MEDDLFAAYFGKVKGASYPGGLCPTFKIPGRTFPVVDHYLEDAVELTGFRPQRGKKSDRDPADSNELGDGYSDTTKDVMQSVDEKTTDFRMIGEIVSHVHRNRPGSGSILVFLSGVPEINKCQRELEYCSGSGGLWILPCHGNLTADEQRQVFKHAPKGKRKVVLATNIAETSITIDDCEVVIDTGKVKEMRFDPLNQMACLTEGWVSQAGATQRRGRAGRVKEGECYKLFSRSTFNKMSTQQTAEIHRVALDGLALQVLVLGLATGGPGGVARFLNGALDPPSQDAIDNALQELQQIGAIDDEEELMPLGYHLAALPVNARLAKLLIFGCVLRCIEPVLSIAATLGGRSPFRNMQNVEDEDEKEEVAKNRKKLSANCPSDHIIGAKAVCDNSLPNFSLLDYHPHFL
jgi:HrpA-like RNA helicase